jgi:hypothetical protein
VGRRKLLRINQSPDGTPLAIPLYDWGKPAREATMANFTQLHLGNKTTQENSQKPQDKPSLSKEKALFGAGLLAVTVLSGVLFLITNGCSKGPAKSAPAISSNQDVVTPQAPMNSAIVPQPPAQPVKPVHKRVQRKAPTATYSDPVNGISFRYPKSYVLKTGDEPNLDLAGMGPVKVDFVQPGGMTVVAVEIPHNAYPGTDFSSAFFSVSVNSDLSPTECELFAFPQSAHSETEPVAPAKAKIAGTEFSVTEDVGGGENNDPRTRYYHRFENGNCYEFSMGLGTSDSTMAGLKPVNREQVFRKLEQILATVKLQPGIVPEMANGTQVNPVVEGGKE